MKLSHYRISLFGLACLCAACSSAPEALPLENAPVSEAAPVETLVAVEAAPVVAEALAPLPATAEEPAVDFSLEAALRRSCETLLKTLPDTSSIAVISIASDNLSEGEFVVKTLSFLLLNTRLFNLVERRTLDPIMVDRRFQLTGEVDDTSALSIGRSTGAEIVMTGAISASESEKYLRLRALDVESKQVLAMTSERFID
jgi:curli biogenesis system outer membrane secretion channel CsgG